MNLTKYFLRFEDVWNSFELKRELNYNLETEMNYSQRISRGLIKKNNLGTWIGNYVRKERGGCLTL